MRRYFITIYNGSGSIIAEYIEIASSATKAVIEMLEEEAPILNDEDRILVQYSVPV